jgi:pSer/pThr/pTyr-binding forkhead associated (FHA) protein
MAKVIVSIDGVVIKEMALSKARSTLGRRPYNDIVIDNLSVSGEHVVFTLVNGVVTLEDNNSTNGTYVNGMAIKKQLLQNADVIEIGKYKIVFVDEQDIDKAPSIASNLSSNGTAIDKPIQGVGPALIRILSGVAMGRDLPLTKVVTTVGKPGVSVASITRRQTGYVLTKVEGPGALLLNGQSMEKVQSPLNHGDVIELADTSMQFALS